MTWTCPHGGIVIAVNGPSDIVLEEMFTQADAHLDAGCDAAIGSA